MYSVARMITHLEFAWDHDIRLHHKTQGTAGVFNATEPIWAKTRSPAYKFRAAVPHEIKIQLARTTAARAKTSLSLFLETDK